MKTQKNKRWRWMAGATAAGVTASQASAITINLVNNYISGWDGNHLNMDLTGDGHPDLTIANAFNFKSGRTSSGIPHYSGYSHFRASVNLNGVLAYARRTNSAVPNYATMRLGSRMTYYFRPNCNCGVYGAYSLTGSIPIFFKDLHINGGAPTSGVLQVTVSDGAEIDLDSFTYTSNTSVEGATRAVPDRGSSLVLLAMGAGGILAFRRWKAAQGRS